MCSKSEVKHLSVMNESCQILLCRHPEGWGLTPPRRVGGSFTGIHTDGKMGSKSEVKHLSVMNEWEACFLFPRALAFD